MNFQTQNQQEQAVFDAFLQKPMTMKEVDIQTGIMRENICRYVKNLRNTGRIAILRQRICKITKHKANEYTTDPKLFPKPQQPTLFD
ncbi:hypothetical protein M2T70_04735 [Elizabethkingia anophelis]|uniref:hypothetical protein n=1 Tax=Elizabethkingia anophelis TaxID=1117645 RepID=UPI000BA86DBF|nr:hypothetical protein [Elizabethkingia anophelis]ASV77961.1 hypothetical protein A6J37_04630 [Elizabethkingia anophelis]MCL1648250.1 hypothetical protein [Elizabethkingia anophelis]MCL1683644.1 hypothetical protein [Elizabethkingia anophelis]MDV3460752.1 hypothetical protein [Elizabethkingia anophelis]MDV3571623.1 hypothetical protein [Elizabethkingia anophelis]